MSDTPVGELFLRRFNTLTPSGVSILSIDGIAYSQPFTTIHGFVWQVWRREKERTVLLCQGARDEVTRFIRRTLGPEAKVNYLMDSVGDGDTIRAGENANVSAGVGGLASGGARSYVMTGAFGISVVRGDRGCAITGDYGLVEASDFGTAHAGDYGTARAGWGGGQGYGWSGRYCADRVQGFFLCR